MTLKKSDKILSAAGTLSDNPKAVLFPPTNHVKMSTEQQYTATLQGYLKSLDEPQLDQALNEILGEIRRRESEQMKRDVLTHSQALRLQNLRK
jgi:hypothetical protein